jgi:putative (di)nucleoside polyphosphate hydrolase
MSSQKSLPYRPCAGMMVLNSAGLVFIGRRTEGPEHLNGTHAWQMPQGGIDKGEDPYEAALRELHEETNIRSVQKLGEISGWLKYDLPGNVVKKAWGGKYRGQKQKWYALRFTGKESEIDVANPAGGHDPEFVEWRWVAIRELPELVIPFKRPTYERVVKEFERFVRQISASPSR